MSIVVDGETLDRNCAKNCIEYASVQVFSMIFCASNINEMTKNCQRPDVIIFFPRIRHTLSSAVYCVRAMFSFIRLLFAGI